MAISIGKIIRSFATNDLQPNYFLLGSDSFLQNFFVKSLKKKFDFNQRAIYLNLKEESDVNFLIEQLNSMSLFSSKNIFVLRNFNHLSRKNQNTLDIFLKRKELEIILVFILDDYRITNKFSKTIAEQSILIDTQTPFYEKKIKEWVIFYLKQRKYKINNQTIDFLIQNYGDDLSNIINEIEKVILFDQKYEKVHDYNKSIFKQMHVWNLLDSLGNKNMNLSISIFKNLILNGYSAIPIIINLSNFYIELLSNNINSQYNGLNKIINSRLNKYKLNYEYSEISNIILELRNIDIILKSTSIKEDLLFIPLILKICKGKYE